MEGVRLGGKLFCGGSQGAPCTQLLYHHHHPPLLCCCHDDDPKTGVEPVIPAPTTVQMTSSFFWDVMQC